MSFFCAGSTSQNVKKKVKNSSKPTSQPFGKSSSNGQVTPNSFQDNKKSLPTIPFSDNPNTRRMIVLQEYKPVDNQGLFVQRGEQVQVLNQQGDWYYARNESKKEGFVPCSHLMPPYSAMRSGRKSQSNSIRPTASNSTIHDMDPPSRVPMHSTQSAGVPRPQDEFMNRANSYKRRDSSPQVLSVNNETCNNNNGMTGAMYEQKYSPSSSSGVASMNGPSSPSFQSLPEGGRDSAMGRQSSGSSLTQEQASISSYEENGGTEPYQNGHGNEEHGMRSHYTNSESSLMHMKARPLPHPPPFPDHEGVYLDKRMNHIYSTITNGEDPPPIPPRERPVVSHSQPFADTDEYISPADAVVEQPGPHLERPRIHSLSDAAREGQRLVQSNVDYSEVFHGKVRPHRSNGYHHHGNDTGSEHSEGGSSNRSSRRNSHSRRAHEQIVGSREFVPIEEAQPGQPHVPAQSSSTRIFKFRKCLWGVYVVTETFESQDENELSVLEGEHVSVWNQDDQDWYWIVKHSTSEEGFVPSRFLKEVVASDSRPVTASTQSHQVPPIPPKQQHHSSHAHPDAPGQFHSHTQTHESRSSNQMSRSRGRLNSDGSSRSRSSLKANHSITSVDKMEIPASPSTTPPPPYCEYEASHNPPPSRHHSLSQHEAHVSHHPPPTRHHSLSQHEGHSSHHGGQMQRTRSQGHVIRRPHQTPPLQRYLSPPETYDLRSPPATADGGTLV